METKDWENEVEFTNCIECQNDIHINYGYYNYDSQAGEYTCCDCLTKKEKYENESVN